MQIFIHRNDQKFGPYTIDQIERFLTDGKITPEDFCRANDETDWSTVARRLAMSIPARYFTTSAPGLPPPAEMQIFIHRDEQEYGPYTLDQIREFLTDGSITPEDYCRVNDETEWSTVAVRMGRVISVRFFATSASDLPPSVAQNEPTDTPSTASSESPRVAPAKKKWGCFKIGCTGVVGLIAFFVLIGIIGNLLPRSPEETADLDFQKEAKTNFSNQVSISGEDTFALLDRASIAGFERDCNPSNNPGIVYLEEQIKQYPISSTEWNGLSTELNAQLHQFLINVQQQYVANGKAEVIAAGTYTPTGYFENSGEPTVPKDNDIVWCEITCNGKTVYVCTQLQSP